MTHAVHPRTFRRAVSALDVPFIHTPVLASEVLALTAPTSGETVVDGTLGLAGHAQLFLQKIGSTGRLIGCDADQRNLTLVRETLATYPNVTLHHANFRQLAEFVPANSADIVLLDLGISSAHLDDATRGFSFRADGPLDMRLDTRQPLTAAEIVNEWNEEQLIEIFREYGEIHSARHLATAILESRKQQPITTTNQFRTIVETVSGRILAQAFQALRIAVNDELAALTAALTAAESILKPGGRLAVIAFHSLEDRLVKEFLRQRQHTTFTLLTKKPVTPTESEIESNPRARSAKLRVGIKRE